MKILYAGTPEIAVPTLEALSKENAIVGVLTALDKISGRGRKIIPSPVKMAAQRLGLPVLQPSLLNSQARENIAALGADLLVTFAYGRIFGPKFLALFPEGGINMHPSLLPRYRGPTPLTAAILAGENHTALSIQKIALDVDAGDIIRQKILPLNGKETTASLSSTLAQAAVPEMMAALAALKTGSAECRKQNHQEATYCSMLKKEDGLIDWQNSAGKIERMIRAYTPWPRAFTSLGSDTLFLLEATVCPQKGKQRAVGDILGVDNSRGILLQTGEGIMALSRLQLASRKPLDFRAFLHGVSLTSDMFLGVR